MTADSTTPPISTAKPRTRALATIPFFDEPLLIELLTKHRLNPTWISKLWRHVLHHEEFLLPPCENSEEQEERYDRIWKSMETAFVQLPVRLLPLLKSSTSLMTTQISHVSISKDGTVKLLICLQDKQQIETVVISHSPPTRFQFKRPNENVDADADQYEDEEEEAESENNHTDNKESSASGRVTLCVSSQVGCSMKCTFCATGTLGKIGNLFSGEILEQLIHASRFKKIRNVVFMGEGEPLDNYHNVLAALQAMVDQRTFALSSTRITVSTVGIVPRMYQLISDAPYVHLAVSLHAPTQELRETIVPSGRSYHIDKIMKVVDDYLGGTSRRALLQYILIDQVNDTLEHAEQLADLLLSRPRSLLVNLIPYNPTEVEAAFRRPSNENVSAFSKALRARGLLTTIRKEMGTDVDGACGQLESIILFNICISLLLLYWLY